jgi:hypothetical protein
MNSTQALSRNTVLDSVRANQPAGQPMPTNPRFHTNQPRDLVASFCESIARMAGVVVTEGVPNLDSFLCAKFPDAKVICSATPEYAGTIKPASLNHWSEASEIDVCVLRSAMGMAETASILLSEVVLQVNTIALLAHDLVVLLEPKANRRKYPRWLRTPIFQTEAIQRSDDRSFWFRRYWWDCRPSGSGREDTNSPSLDRFECR